MGGRSPISRWRKALIAFTRRAPDGARFTSTSMIVGCGASSTRETICFCQDAADAGSDYAISVTMLLQEPSIQRDPARLLPRRGRRIPDPGAHLQLPRGLVGPRSEFGRHPCPISAFQYHRYQTQLRQHKETRPNRVPGQTSFLTFVGSAGFTLQTLVAGGAPEWQI